MMSLSPIFWCCLLYIFGLSFQARAETFEKHVNSYCEGVRKPSRQLNAEFTDEIARLSKEKHIILEPKLLARYPSLIYLVVLSNDSPWKSQKILDDLESLSANDRVTLCRKLEMARLQKMGTSKVNSRLHNAATPMALL